MAEIDPASGIDLIHGKLNKSDPGYFYVVNGKQCYRLRNEGYQQKQSRRQKYNSEVFAYANAQMAQNYGTPEGKIRLAEEYEAAHHRGPNGKTYATPWSWRFCSYQFEYRQAHPFES